MNQFLTQVILFPIIGCAVWALSRRFGCKSVGVCIAHPRKSALNALLAVAISMLGGYLLILWLNPLHGPTGKVGPRLHLIGGWIPQLAQLAIFVLPAGIFMLKNREGLCTVGITRINLWQSLVIGIGLALLTFYFRSDGLFAKLARVKPHNGIGLAFCAFVGFGEEFLFRGYLQNRLIVWLGRWSGWVLASVLMALVHFPHRLFIDGLAVGDAVGASLGLIPVSLFMGFVMLCTRNIVASGLFHTFLDWVYSLV